MDVLLDLVLMAIAIVDLVFLAMNLILGAINVVAVLVLLGFPFWLLGAYAWRLLRAAL